MLLILESESDAYFVEEEEHETPLSPSHTAAFLQQQPPSSNWAAAFWTNKGVQEQWSTTYK